MKPKILIKCKRTKCGKEFLTTNPDRKYCSNQCCVRKDEGIKRYRKNGIILTKWENGNITIVREFPGGHTYQFREGDLKNIFILLDEYIPIEILRKVDERKELMEKKK